MNHIASTCSSRQFMARIACASSGKSLDLLDLLGRSAVGVLEHAQRGSPGLGVDGYRPRRGAPALGVDGASLAPSFEGQGGQRGSRLALPGRGE